MVDSTHRRFHYSLPDPRRQRLLPRADLQRDYLNVVLRPIPPDLPPPHRLQILPTPEREITQTEVPTPLRVDEDGDGTVDFSLAPKLNDIVTLPLPPTPPTYRFDGFLQPINDTTYHPEQSPSVFKGGSTVPVKFQLKKADGTIIQATTSGGGH